MPVRGDAARRDPLVPRPGEPEPAQVAMSTAEIVGIVLVMLTIMAVIAWRIAL